MNLITQTLEWENNLYVIKRMIKEVDIHEKKVIPYKEYIAAVSTMFLVGAVVLTLIIAFISKF